MPREIDQSPDPSSHIKTLRRIGYTFNSAIADLIDNAIAADAKNIEVVALPGLAEPQVSVIDDGVGMAPEDLIENMRIGCKDPDAHRRNGDLGRFGSGMKTASFSQSRQLTVVSKAKNHNLVAARWDIDKIESTNSWCLEFFEGDELLEIAGLSFDGSVESGTQVIWGKLTCIDTGSHATDRDSELAAKLSELRSYLGLHFYRFMSGPQRRQLRLNNDLIKPIDPFMAGQKGYQEGPSARMRCKGGHIEIKTHVLPHFKKMDPDLLDDLGGPQAISHNQGLYIFREKRLISAGGWMGMSANSRLGALARVQVDIPSSLDNDWSTDVKKSSLQIPPRVKRELRKFLADPVKRSKRVHSYRGKMDKANKYWKICEDENEKTINYQIDQENPELRALVQRFGREDAIKLINYLKEVSRSLPINHIFEKMAERPRDIDQKEADYAALETLVDKVFKD